MSTPLAQRRLTSSLAEATEADLVQGARAGDESALRELIRRLNPRLFRVARGIAASDAEAEEIVQDAWLAAFSRLDTFREEARFSTWVTRIALNAALMRNRRARACEEYDTVTEAPPQKETVLAFPGLAASGAGPAQPEAALGQAQLRALLEHAVAELPPKLRLVFLLRDVAGPEETRPTETRKIAAGCNKKPHGRLNLPGQVSRAPNIHAGLTATPPKPQNFTSGAHGRGATRTEKLTLEESPAVLAQKLRTLVGRIFRQSQSD